MLESITLKFTEMPDPLVVPASGVTIFVGPNNSGKSLVLRELEQQFASNNDAIDSKILSDFELLWPTQDELDAEIKSISGRFPQTQQDYLRWHKYTQNGIENGNTNITALLKFAKSHENKRWVASQFFKLFMIRLDGRTRFLLTNDAERGDLLPTVPAPNMLASLYKDDAIRKELRDIVFDAFKLYFTIDALRGNELRIRLSSIPPDGNEQNFNDAARNFHEAAIYIKDTSDGVQAFLGIMAVLIAGNYRLALIDEPEAFLHPPLARKLGYQITKKIASNGGCLLASTHSADFLLGCIQATPTVRVVRLEYSEGKSKGRIADSDVISSMYKTPLLRSANVISGLFHDGVVVTESDNDRAYYSEIYSRLSEQEQNYPSVLFVNAQGKHTIPDIIEPLRKLGVPAAGIVDSDVLEEGGAHWMKWMKCGVPSGLHQSMGQQRSGIHNAAKAAGLLPMKKNGGIERLPDAEKASATDLCDRLDSHGIFVVRRGELENWLPILGAVGQKTDWVMSAFDKMGSDPSLPHYVRPASGDVWDFLRTVVRWIRNPARKGIS